MSQKTILSFFKSSEQASTKDVKKHVVIEESSSKKKSKRKVQCIESDDDTDSVNKNSESNSSKAVKNGKKQKEVNSKKKPKADKENVKQEKNKNSNTGKSENLEEINGKDEKEASDKMEVDEEEKKECIENGNIDSSTEITEETKNLNETNQNESTDFIPKRKTARKQMSSSRNSKKVSSPLKDNKKSESKPVENEISKNDSILKSGSSSNEEEIDKCVNEVDESKLPVADNDVVNKDSKIGNKKSPKNLKTDSKQKSKASKKGASPKKPDKKDSIQSFFTPLKKSADQSKEDKDNTEPMKKSTDETKEDKDDTKPTKKSTDETKEDKDDTKPTKKSTEETKEDEDKTTPPKKSTDKTKKNKKTTPPKKSTAKTKKNKESEKNEIQSHEMEIEDSPVKKTAKSKKKIQRIESDDEDSGSPEKPVKEENTEQDAGTSKSNENLTKSDESENDNKDSLSPEINAKKSDSKKSKQKSSPPKKADADDAKKDDKPKLGIKSTSASGIVYDPLKSHYHPINDACWKKGEKVPYLALAKTLECIENTSGRLKAIETLSNYFRSVIVLCPDDLLQSVYLCLNRIAPEYEAIELGVGETLLMKAVAQATGRTVEKIKAEVAVKGDLGLVSESSRGNQRVMFAPPKLTVASVFSKFFEIAKMSGNSAMGKKTDKIQSLFVACRECEARFIIRSLSGRLRIGLAEQSVLTALARAAVLTPPGQSYPPEKIDGSKGMSADKFKEFLESQTLILKTAYCECPNYDLVIPVLLEKGISALPDCCQLSPGRPLKPMLAHPSTGIDIVLERFDKNTFTCEFKYDGERAQIHMTETGEVKIFSRNQEDNTSKYPDVISRISKCINESAKSFILDSEAVAWDAETKQILPFQALSTRKRKDAVESEIVVKVCIIAFDLLYLNGESLVKKPLKDRRSLLHSSFNEVENEFMFAKYMDTDSAETMQEFLDESVKGNCEGLMVKALEVDASYEIAKRSHNWLKLKKDYLQGCGDTMDVLVIGGYYGKGKRTGTYGGFLLACYDEDNEEYQSVCKLGVGFKNEDLETHTSFFKQHVIEKPKPYYRYDHGLEPDVWFEAVQVWEIKCADLSISPVHKAAIGIVDPEKGISLRFPRYMRIRDDKSPENCTTSIQVANMYKQQQQIQNTNKNVKGEEDYY